MNHDRIEGSWEQVKGNVQKMWGKLTNDDLDVIEGDRKALAGKIQERYGVAQDEAKKQIDNGGGTCRWALKAHRNDYKNPEIAAPVPPDSVSSEALFRLSSFDKEQKEETAPFSTSDPLRAYSRVNGA
eukprot:gene34692-44481_t